MPRITTAARVSALETKLDTLIGLVAAQAEVALAQATAPAKGSPAKGSAAFGGKTFQTYVADRRASALPCGIPAHGDACNRTFSPKSSGRTDHEPRIV